MSTKKITSLSALLSNPRDLNAWFDYAEYDLAGDRRALFLSQMDQFFLDAHRVGLGVYHPKESWSKESLDELKKSNDPAAVSLFEVFGSDDPSRLSHGVEKEINQTPLENCLAALRQADALLDLGGRPAIPGPQIPLPAYNVLSLLAAGLMDSCAERFTESDIVLFQGLAPARQKTLLSQAYVRQDAGLVEKFLDQGVISLAALKETYEINMFLLGRYLRMKDQEKSKAAHADQDKAFHRASFFASFVPPAHLVPENLTNLLSTLIKNNRPETLRQQGEFGILGAVLLCGGDRLTAKDFGVDLAPFAGQSPLLDRLMMRDELSDLDAKPAKKSKF